MSQAPLVGPGAELQLTIDGRAVPHLDVVAKGGPEPLTPEAELVDAAAPAEVIAPELELADVAPAAAAAGNQFLVAERLALRAASPATRKQYATIYRSFGDWLMGELGRPPLVEDLDADAIAAWGRHLEQQGGRGGRPAAPSTRRVYLNLVRALARELGRPDADTVRVPGHKPAPPETLTDTDYRNLLRVPDTRTTRGRRDVALLRVLGDCGLRSEELRRLTAASVRRPRSNARHYVLHVLGKGNAERNVEIPAATKVALDAWLAVHPLAERGRPLLDEHPLFVRLGRHGRETPVALTAQSVHKIVNTSGVAAGIPERLCHHALRGFWVARGSEPHLALGEFWAGSRRMRPPKYVAMYALMAASSVYPGCRWDARGRRRRFRGRGRRASRRRQRRG